MESHNQAPATKSVNLKLASGMFKFKNHGCIHIVNETGGPICVYHQPTKPERVCDSLKVGAGVNVQEGGVGAHLEKTIRDGEKAKVGSVIIEPSVNGKPHAVPLEYDESYISIQRLDGAGNPLDLWDCVDHFVRTGTKLTVSGLATPMASHRVPHAAPTTQSSGPAPVGNAWNVLSLIWPMLRWWMRPASAPNKH